MDAALVVTVVCAVIGAAGTVAGAVIQAWSRRPQGGQPLSGGDRWADGGPGAGTLTAGRDARPDGYR